VPALAGWAKVNLDLGERRRVTVQVACNSLSYSRPGRKHDAGQSEGAAHAADPTRTDPASQNTEGRWVTARPSDPSVSSSVSDIRLADTVTLRGGTCAENSDSAGCDGATGGGGSGGGVAGRPRSQSFGRSGLRAGSRGCQGPPGPAARSPAHHHDRAHAPTLHFADGTWETAPAEARTAQLRLVKSGRTYAKGRAMPKCGKMRVGLQRTARSGPASTGSGIRVRGKTASVKVKIGALHEHGSARL
jgi:hypothetical protein